MLLTCTLARAGADIELGGNLGVGAPGGEQPQHRQLTASQAVRHSGLHSRRRVGDGRRGGLQRDPGPLRKEADLSQQRRVRRRGRLAGVQLGLGLAPPRVPGTVRAAQVLPGLGCDGPRLGPLGPVSRVRSASQVARSAGMVATNGWPVNRAPPTWPAQDAGRPSSSSSGDGPSPQGFSSPAARTPSPACRPAR